MSNGVITTSSLIIASSLVVISLIFSYFQKIKLEKDTIIAVVRAVIQLLAVGYILEYIFGLENPWFVSLVVVAMILSASFNAAKRGKEIRNSRLVSFIAITVGTFVTLIVLVLSGALEYVAYQIIPVSGMIISNSMIALGLSYKHMVYDFKNKKHEVETKLSIGADIYQSSEGIIRESIRTGMLPTIDSAKTLGIVALPGMMTGLILAGTSPIYAIRYQIMVTFMLMSTTAISTFVACYLSYRSFFNKRKQLI